MNNIKRNINLHFIFKQPENKILIKERMNYKRNDRKLAINEIITKEIKNS